MLKQGGGGAIPSFPIFPMVKNTYICQGAWHSVPPPWSPLRNLLQPFWCFWCFYFFSSSTRLWQISTDKHFAAMFVCCKQMLKIHWRRMLTEEYGLEADHHVIRGKESRLSRSTDALLEKLSYLLLPPSQGQYERVMKCGIDSISGVFCLINTFDDLNFFRSAT